MLILGIESSCDETGAALVAEGRSILSNVVASQTDLHSKFGGVVPELASRRHLELVNLVVEEAVGKTGKNLSDIEGIAVTCGPGLVGSLLVGVETAKALAYVLRVPLIGINHLEGHLYAAWLEHALDFPVMGLIVSGGHTELVFWKGHGRYERLGRTRDDAAGEVFDKVAKLLELGYPGGPKIEKLAATGNASFKKFPRAKMKDKSMDFSFSGLKTSVRLAVAAKGISGPDLAAGFQQAVIESLIDRTIEAAREKNVRQVVITGGVAVNQALRRELVKAGKSKGLEVLYPSAELCTDNAAMIAAAGFWRLKSGEKSGSDLNADPNLELK